MRRMRRAVAVFVAVVAVSCLLVLTVFALAGGVRVRTPIGAMRAELDLLRIPDAQTIHAEERGEHLCFVQCEEWAVIRYYALGDRSPIGGDTERLCARLEAAARHWLGSSLSGGVATSAEQRDYYECGYSLRGVAEHDDWCTDISLLPIGRDNVFGADVRVIVGVEC